MNSPILRVSMAFATMPDDTLIIAAGTVRDKLYNAGPFTAPPVLASELETTLNSFQASKWAQPNGGKMVTATKNALRADLIDKLRRLAFYVQIISANDLAILLSSGFEAIKSNRTSYPLRIGVENYE